MPAAEPAKTVQTPPRMFSRPMREACNLAGLKTPEDLSSETIDTVLVYLDKARSQAERIRDNAPGGSHLESVLERTIVGITQEMAQLKYLLAKRDHPLPKPCRMRPAL